METIQSLELQKEEIKTQVKKLETARQKFIAYGSIKETDLPIDSSIDFRSLVLSFLDKQIEIAEFLNTEIESSLSYYEENGN